MKFGTDLGSTVSCQIWPRSVKGDGHKSPAKCENLIEVAIFQRFLPRIQGWIKLLVGSMPKTSGGPSHSGSLAIVLFERP